jgi:CRISPR-associated protein (TIGR02584 family)
MTEYNMLAVTGMSPQVITETLFGLHQKGRPLPKRLYIITTEKGKEQVWLTLGVSSPNSTNKLEQFLKDYHLPPIEFSEENIWVVKDKYGQPLLETDDEQGHHLMADLIVEKVRQLTSNGKPPLHASLAGGRKTMTFFLGYAMSLYGRVSDELSHVLVSKGFENLLDFFYPTPYDSPITSSKNQLINAKDAKVSLSNIPFVRMREDTPQAIIDGQKSYSELIDSINAAKQKPTLHIDAPKRTLICNGTAIKLQPSLFYFYLWLVEHYKNNGEGWTIPSELGELHHANAFSRIYELYNDEYKVEILYENNFQTGMTKNFFVTKKSKVNSEIKKALGKLLSFHFVIDDINDLLIPEKRTFYFQNAVRIESNNITIEWGDVEL